MPRINRERFLARKNFHSVEIESYASRKPVGTFFVPRFRYRITVGVIADSLSTPPFPPSRLDHEERNGFGGGGESMRGNSAIHRSYDGRINQLGRECESRKSRSEIRRLAFVDAALTSYVETRRGGKCREKIRGERGREEGRERERAGEWKRTVAEK